MWIEKFLENFRIFIINMLYLVFFEIIVIHEFLTTLLNYSYRVIP